MIEIISAFLLFLAGYHIGDLYRAIVVARYTLASMELAFILSIIMFVFYLN